LRNLKLGEHILKNKAVRVALEFGPFHFLENYRADVCLGVIRYAKSRPDWELVYSDQHLSLVGNYREVEELPDLGVKGIIMTWCDEEKWKKIKKLKLKAVTISSDVPVKQIPRVLTDDRLVGEMAADHFLERGFQNFAFCGSLSVPWDQLRWEGFNKRLASRGFTSSLFESKHLENMNIKKRKSSRLMNWLKDQPKPLAIMASDDVHGAQLIDTTKRSGLRVPGDVAILGIDNSPLVCNATLPSLTSIELDSFGVGYQAAELMQKLILGRKTSLSPMLLPPIGIHTRQSSEAFATTDEVLLKAMDYLFQNLSNPIGVAEIAGASGVSRRTLELRFKNSFSKSIARYLLERRIRKACDLLLDFNLTIDEVSQLSGFRTSSHFCSTFRDIEGDSPAKWRNKRRKSF
jgi:LacI family transcriptional regulator